MPISWWWKQQRFRRQIALYRLLREFMTRDQARMVLRDILRDLER